MAEAQTRDAWSRTSALLALIANCHRDPKRTRAFKVKDFDPFVQSAKPPKVGIAVLKDVFIKRGPETGDRRL